MSSIWEDFEIDCTEYLNRKFGDYASFKHEGDLTPLYQTLKLQLSLAIFLH